jgi:translation initiation factor 2B subunit (eIF-2B alpha/beta/delta family)
MASWIYTRTLHKSRLSVIIMPDCAVATAVQNIDIVLLGADCINPNGNVSNKMGSLAAALCAKQQNQNVSVVVLSDTEKIAVPGEGMEGHEIHPSSELSTAWAPETRGALEDNEHVQIFGEWFEWVPAELVDVYVTERGRLTARDVANLANEVKELKEGIFRTEEE